MDTAPEIHLIPNPEMEDEHYGVSVAHFGEDGDMIALGHHSTRRALAAFNRHARHFVGLANLADDRSAKAADYTVGISTKWAVFRQPNPEREDPDFVWVADFCELTQQGAQPVTVLEL